jgi:hypothetical protein
MNDLDEPFRPGELVTLRDVGSEPIGRVVTVEGDRAEVAWHKYPGHDHQTTLEPTAMLRRVHESEMEAE